MLLRANGLTGPSPTIVVVHGYTGTPTGIERFVELTERANTSGIAIAYPEGSPTPDGGFGWNSGAAVMATDLVDDVTVLGEMIDAMVMSGCVDPTRVILTGESNGAALALVAACEPQLATRFMRVVLVNAAVDRGVLQRCSNTAQAVPLTVVAGAHDETTPLEGSDNFLPVDEWFAVAASQLTACPTIESVPPLRRGRLTKRRNRLLSVRRAARRRRRHAHLAGNQPRGLRPRTGHLRPQRHARRRSQRPDGGLSHRPVRRRRARPVHPRILRSRPGESNDKNPNVTPMTWFGCGPSNGLADDGSTR